MLGLFAGVERSDPVGGRREESLLHPAGLHVVPVAVLRVLLDPVVVLAGHKLDPMPKDSDGHLIPGRISPMRHVPTNIPRPEYVGRKGPTPYTGDDVYTPREIELIRESGRIAAQAIARVGEAVRPGVTTEELDVIGHEFLLANDAYPSTLDYRGYPKSICSSVNEVIC